MTFKEEFEAGAKWAEEHLNLSSPWHQASEEPAGTDWRIICQDEKGNYWVQSKDGVIFFHNTWKEYAATEMVAKWAYIDELIKK